jgi:hypothetical protein
MSSDPARTSNARPGGSSLSHGEAPVAPMTRLVDEMLDRYVEWREDAYAVKEAYTRWCGAPARDEKWRFSVYMASLELEEASAKTYAAVVSKLDSRLSAAAGGAPYRTNREAPREPTVGGVRPPISPALRTNAANARSAGIARAALRTLDRGARRASVLPRAQDVGSTRRSAAGAAPPCRNKRGQGSRCGRCQRNHKCGSRPAHGAEPEFRQMHVRWIGSYGPVGRLAPAGS